MPETTPRPDVPDVPEPPDDRPTADRNAVDRARTDGGTRALIARAIWTRDTQPTTGAQCGGYVYEIADRVASEAVPVIERQVRERVAAEIYTEARKWAANAQASSTVPERERRFAVAAALTKAATGVERGES